MIPLERGDVEPLGLSWGSAIDRQSREIVCEGAGVFAVGVGFGGESGAGWVELGGVKG